MQEHEPWEIGEMRKKTSNYRDRAGRTELKRVRSSTHNGDIKALCHVETHHHRPRVSLFEKVLIHRLTVFQSTAPFPHRIYRLTVSLPHRRTVLPLPNRSSPSSLTEVHQISPSTVFPYRYRLISPIPNCHSSRSSRLNRSTVKFHHR